MHPRIDYKSYKLLVYPQAFCFRHTGESRYPVSNYFSWIPAFAGMTEN